MSSNKKLATYTNEKSTRIPVKRTNLGLKSPYVKHLEDKLRPPNKILKDVNLFRLSNKPFDLPPLESPMEKTDASEALEEFEHPVINEKEKYDNTTELVSQLDNDDRNYTTTFYSPPVDTTATTTPSTTIATTTAALTTITTTTAPSTTTTSTTNTTTTAPSTTAPSTTAPSTTAPSTTTESDTNTIATLIRNRTDSEEELIKETVMLFLSDHNEETTDFILPGQTDILEHMTTTGSLKNSINSYYGKTTPKSEITINKGILTLITENMTVKVKATKLIGYIAGARNESVILIFKKNNITVPIKNKVTFKTIIVLLDEILSKRNCIFWPF